MTSTVKRKDTAYFGNKYWFRFKEKEGNIKQLGCDKLNIKKIAYYVILEVGSLICLIIDRGRRQTWTKLSLPVYCAYLIHISI